MNLQQIIDEQNSKHQPADTFNNFQDTLNTADKVFIKCEKSLDTKGFYGVLALMSLADYEDSTLQHQYEAGGMVDCFGDIPNIIVWDIDDLNKFEQAK